MAARDNVRGFEERESWKKLIEMSGKRSLRIIKVSCREATRDIAASRLQRGSRGQ